MHSTEFGSKGRKKINKETALFELLLKIKDEQTMIYCSSSRRARMLSKKFYEFIKDKTTSYNYTVPLVEWVEENISKRWGLIALLKYKIAFHDGALQKHITSSIVKYFNEGHINFLFCTSTIIEGVNTSTKNIIIFDNKKGNKSIDYFDYSNIKGRAGRMMIHYIGKVYNFNPPIPKEEQMIIDIPFFQQNPIKDEVLIQLNEQEVKNKESQQYKKLQEIPIEERKLFKRNGVLVWGQKEILEILRRDINKKSELIIWTGMPKYEQLEYILNLGWDNLLKKSETKYPMTKKKLTKVTFDYSLKQDIRYLVISNYIFLKDDERNADLSKQELFDEAVRDAFGILRHWFQYKVPKILRTINSLQEFVCNERGIRAGNYSYCADIIESDFVRNNMSILLEYGIPKSAIKKLENIFDENISEEEVLKILKNTDILKYSNLLEYEINKITEGI